MAESLLPDTDAIMKGCRLTRANLRQAKLTGADLENDDLSGCNLTGACTEVNSPLLERGAQHRSACSCIS